MSGKKMEVNMIDVTNLLIFEKWSRNSADFK